MSITAHVNEYTLPEVRDLIDTHLRNIGDIDRNEIASSRTIEYALSNYYDKEFYDGWELEDSAEGMIHGWDAHTDDISNQVEEMLRNMQEKVNDYIASSTRRVLDVSGGDVDIDRYLRGEPEHMWETWMDEDTLRGKAIKVLVNCVASSTVQATDLVKRGAAVVAAVEAVIASGMNVELWVGESVKSGQNRGQHVCEMVLLKEYNDIIDPNVLAYTIGHPTMLRRVCFFLNEQRDMKQRELFGFTKNGGYGKVTDFPAEIVDQFDLVIPRYKAGDETNVEELYDRMMERGDQRASEYA